ncbi:helix-turn-helix domain-containing protein [Pseudobutyrivibrio sp.]|uniref:helix-turn-helix domain-containing protein n=1 Tax=Pseudobutyrivibrio sp. TaxID=2014367 RepID=UPI0025FE20A2|nr:helix-turn-helix transcriptional regulator [Pseudobutyrivibrio sp.]MBR5649068.1 helix-turn-helix transcriptional regulator [Pseudobutyrivibrio sp.]
MLKNNVIAEKIKKARNMRGISQAKLAEELGIASSAVAAYETGKRIPKIELREQIARVLMADPLDLSGLELTEDDERRIFNKLLIKYSKDIVKNNDGTISVVLPEEYANLQEMYKQLFDFKIDTYNAFVDDISFQIDMFPESNKENFLDYWLESWPLFDYLQVIKRCIPEEKQADENVIKRMKYVTEHHMSSNYYSKNEEQFKQYVHDFNNAQKAKKQSDKKNKSKEK